MAALPHFADRLIEAAAAKGSPICVCIDPILELMPPSVSAQALGRDGNDPRSAVDAIFDFTLRVLRVVAPLVPAVKFDSAYFERFRAEGVEAYYSLIGEARDLGLLAIGDVKRGDIGASAQAYADAHLADGHAGDGDEDAAASPDAVTVSPICGIETIEPFVRIAREGGKGVFVLVRSSNAGSGALQELALADGRTWAESLADQLNVIASDETLVGAGGYSAVGAVVGAMHAETVKSLRQRLPRSILLVPGHGHHGATADVVRAAFVDGRGAIVSASRSVLYAYRDARYSPAAHKSWESSLERATMDMCQELRQMLET
jgi:orotidine-5'-phosphate decarboxylase